MASIMLNAKDLKDPNCTTPTEPGEEQVLYFGYPGRLMVNVSGSLDELYAFAESLRDAVRRVRGPAVTHDVEARREALVTGERVTVEMTGTIEGEKPRPRPISVIPNERDPRIPPPQGAKPFRPEEGSRPSEVVTLEVTESDKRAAQTLAQVLETSGANLSEGIDRGRVEDGILCPDELD